ncbi:histone acetyltransferase KAT6B [Nematolebias whitei]|uniref:histone acetyltransferase KAT6B n=1 Tax=Nematolebias whitei TaxID=451745 RepID=UPI00189A52E3|nr:histone acetyltransferase KAT6B [Nematolebias whitei]
MSPLVVPGDFSQPASPFGCLDSSAAKHKLVLRHKAGNRRKPASRLDLKAEGDFTVESVLLVSSETESLEQQEQQRRKDGCDNQLELKVKKEEEEDEESEDQESTAFQMRDKENREEEEEEKSEAKLQVSPTTDSSFPLEQNLSEEEVSDTQSMFSSRSSSRASSPNSSRPTAEPPAALRKCPRIPAGVSYKTEDHHSDSSSEEEGVQGDRAEESSFLEEVHSSLKAPLYSHSPDVETVLEIKSEEEEAETEERVEMTVESDEEEEETKEIVAMKEVAEVNKLVNHYLSYPCSVLNDQTEEEEKEAEAHTSSLQDEDAEEVKGNEEGADTEGEDLTVEQFTHHSDEENQQEEEAEEIASEEQVDGVTRPSLSQEVGMEEGVEEDKEERAVEMEEEMLETSEEEPDNGKADTGMSKGREEEVEDEEETMEIIPDPQDEKIQRASPVQEESEGMGEDEDVPNTNQTNGVVTEIRDQVLEEVQEEQENSNQNLEDKREGDKEESGEFMEQEEEEKEKEEEEKEPTQDDQTGVEQESDETMSQLEIKQMKHYPAAESTPPPLSLPESQSNTDSDEVLLSPSCKSTNLHINLVSPSLEDLPSLSHLPPAVADYGQNVPEPPSPGGESSAEEEQAEAAKDEEQNESKQEPNDSSPASVTHPTELGKVHFTIAPARQRPKSSTGLITLSSPVSGPGGVEAEQETKTEPASLVERVIEPGKGRNPLSPMVTSAAARRAEPAESSVVADGNPENPFGVRLRKTSALIHFNSEEEMAESAVESPTFCKVDSPQPVSSKPSVCPPNINKPAVPKKPEVHIDAGGKPRRTSEPAAGRGASGGSDPPSWISVARQKQRIYKGNSLEEMTVKKEEQETKSSLPHAASREHQNKTAESTNKATNKPPLFGEKETKRVLSPPTPVPPQPSRSQPLSKPQVSPVTAKSPPQQPKSPQNATSLPTPVPVTSKPPPCTTSSALSKPDSIAQMPSVTSHPFPSQTNTEKSSLNAPGLPRLAAHPLRGLPPSALPQDEPPWMALAKKKAKAWSEMPQIVQ